MKRIYFIILLVIYGLTINGQTWTSNADGDWDDNGTWTSDAPGFRVRSGDIINIQSVVTANSDIDVRLGGEINVVTDSLIVNAGLVTFVGGIITINEGAVLWVNGDLDNTLWGDIVVNGTLKVTGDVTNWGSDVTVGDNGNIGIGGNFDNNGGTVINDNGGEIVVGGEITPIGSIDGNVIDNVGEDVALPIELLSFHTYRDGKNIIISWKTATEINNDYFTIFVSDNCTDWEILEYVNGSGNSSMPIEYLYEYECVNSKYFMLKQTDYDGNYETFNGLLRYVTNYNGKKPYMIFNSSGQFIGSGYVDDIDYQKDGVYILKNEYKTMKIIKN